MNYWRITGRQPHLRPVEPGPTDETDENAKISQSGGEKAKPPSDLRSKAFCKIDWQGEGHGANAEAGKGSAEADGKHAGGLRDQEAREAEWQGSRDDCHLGRIKRLWLETFLPMRWRPSPPARPPTRAARGIREPIQEASESDTASLRQRARVMYQQKILWKQTRKSSLSKSGRQFYHTDHIDKP